MFCQWHDFPCGTDYRKRPGTFLRETAFMQHVTGRLLGPALEFDHPPRGERRYLSTSDTIHRQQDDGCDCSVYGLRAVSRTRTPCGLSPLSVHPRYHAGIFLVARRSAAGGEFGWLAPGATTLAAIDRGDDFGGRLAGALVSRYVLEIGFLRYGPTGPANDQGNGCVARGIFMFYCSAGHIMFGAFVNTRSLMLFAH
jgi:hypothetical protein